MTWWLTSRYDGSRVTGAETSNAPDVRTYLRYHSALNDKLPFYEEVEGRYHEYCDQFHNDGECPRREVGYCAMCGSEVELDYWGNCKAAGDEWREHEVVGRRPDPRFGKRMVL